MKEKILACICAAALLVPFFGCGRNDATDNIKANVNEWTELTRCTRTATLFTIPK